MVFKRLNSVCVRWRTCWCIFLLYDSNDSWNGIKTNKKEAVAFVDHVILLHKNLTRIVTVLFVILSEKWQWFVTDGKCCHFWM